MSEWVEGMEKHCRLQVALIFIINKQQPPQAWMTFIKCQFNEDTDVGNVRRVDVLMVSVEQHLCQCCSVI